MADRPQRRLPPAEVRLAARLAARESEGPARVWTKVAAALTELGQIDSAVYSAVAETPSPVLDPPLRRLSRAADRSRLWLGIAAAMAAVGGREGRRTAGAGVVALAVDSAVVNIGFKLAAQRRRPDRDEARVPAGRRCRCRTRRRSPPGTLHPASRSPTPSGRRCPWQRRRCACSPAWSATPGCTLGSTFPGMS